MPPAEKCFIFDSIIPLRDGQYSEFVEAIKLLYFEPTFEPDLTTPPGKGRIIFFNFRENF